MTRYTYFHFSFAISNKKKRKTTSSVYDVLCFPVWWHSVGKTNKEPNHPLFVFRLAIIEKHNWDLYPSDALWCLCSLHKTLTKSTEHSCDPGVLYCIARQLLENEKTHRSIRPLPRSETAIIENGRARRMKARYLYFVFSSSKKNKKKVWRIDRFGHRAKASAIVTLQSQRLTCCGWRRILHKW